jgi:hypothetical protein
VVDFVHFQKIKNRALKLFNLFLDEDCVVKLFDFREADANEGGLDSKGRVGCSPGFYEKEE